MATGGTGKFKPAPGETTGSGSWLLVRSEVETSYRERHLNACICAWDSWEVHASDLIARVSTQASYRRDVPSVHYLALTNALLSVLICMAGTVCVTYCVDVCACWECMPSLSPGRTWECGPATTLHFLGYWIQQLLAVRNGLRLGKYSCRLTSGFWLGDVHLVTLYWTETNFWDNQRTAECRMPAHTTMIKISSSVSSFPAPARQPQVRNN